MKLDKVVVNRIRRDRMRLLAQEAGLLLVLLLGLAALLTLIIIPFAIGNTTFSPFVKKLGLSGFTWVAMVVALLLAVLGIGFFLVARRRDLELFVGLTKKAKGYDLKRLGLFLNALDSAADRAGLPAPYLSVLEGEVPNAITYSGEDGPAVGVTAGALGADLSFKDAQAAMAHELANTLTGDYLKRPGSARFDAWSLGLLWLDALLVLVGVPITRLGRSSLFTFALVFAALAFLVLAALWMRHIGKMSDHDYILADSIAVKITEDPEAMAGALEKMDRLVSNSRRVPFPESEMGLRFLFMPPHRWSETAAAFLKRRSVELDYKLNEKSSARRASALQQEMDELVAWSEKLQSERLENLKAIQDGTWPF